MLKEKKIILRKYHEACVFCGSVSGHRPSFGGRYVCPECIEKLNRMIK